MRGVAPLMDAGEERASAAKGATRVVVKSGFYMAFSPGNFAANLPNPVTVLQTWATPVFTFPRADYSTFIAAQGLYTFFGFYDQVYLVSFASKSHLFIYSVYIFESSFLLFTSFGIALESYPGSWRRTTVAFSGLAKKKAVLKGTYTLAMRPIWNHLPAHLHRFNPCCCSATPSPLSL